MDAPLQQPQHGSSAERPKPRNASISRFGQLIVIVYLVFGLSWVLFTYMLNLRLAADIQVQTWIQDVNALIFVVASTVVVQVLVWWDARRLKQATTQRQTSEDRYRTLVEHFPNGTVFLFDHDLCFTVAGGTGLTAAGVTCEDVEGKTLWEIFPTEIADREAPMLRAALQGYAMQSEVPFEDNTFAVHTLPITNRDGFITGGMVMTQNITERARSETALRESEERFRLLFEHSPDAIWLLDPNRVANAWTIVDCNEAAARMHGYERDELIGQTMRFLDSQPTTPQQAAMQHESMWHTSHTSGEDYHRRKDGTLITIEYATVPIRLEGRDLILGVDRDVTVRKVAERDREQIIRQLQETLTRAEALFHTAQSLIATKNVEEVLQEVVDATVMALPADRVMLVTLDQDQRSVHHCVKGGPGAGALMPITFDELWEGLMGWALREREPVLSPKHAPDPRESVAARQQRDHSGCGAVMVAPLHYRGRLLGMLTAIERPDAPDFHTDDLDLLTAMANQAAVAIANAELFHEVNRIAITDELTDLYNRRGFVTMGEREVERSQRTQQPLTAIMVDVDHFKQVNDTYGHTAGDEVLRAIAERCARNVRAVDILGRYGGEEFAILLPDTDLASAQQIAERLRECIATTPISTTGGPISITVSAGIALLKRGAGDLPALLHAADTALYAAKRAGRNSLIVQT